jgi:putative addiction module component (TIGR02574 family)
MSKIDEACAALKTLPPEDQERLADLILDLAAQSDANYQLTDEQIAEIDRRMADPNPEYISLEEVRARLLGLGREP